MPLAAPLRDNHWGSSMLSGVQFIFKDKTADIPHFASKFTKLQHLKRDYKYDFELEKEVLKQYKVSEQSNMSQESKSISDEDKDIKAAQWHKHPSPNLTMIEPEKTSVAVEERPRPQLNRSLVEDFEFQGSQDDPFVAAELGAINDMEELRDVLASIPAPSTQDSDFTRKHMFSSLKSISFPRLSVDENLSDYVPSASTSQPNLFSQSLGHDSKYLVNSSTETETKLSKPTNSDVYLPQKSVSPVQLNLDDEMVKSEDPDTENSPLVLDSKKCAGDNDDSCSLPLPDVTNKSLLSSSYSNTPYVPRSSELTVEPTSPDSHALLEDSIESYVNDPPIVHRLVRMGFRRSQIVAIHDASVGGQNLDDDTLVTQLCNWNELEDKGFAKEVGKAAVIFSPNDLGRALEFATLVSEMVEMGFSLDAVILAVQSSNMNQEEAVVHLLDIGNHPDTSSSSHSTNHSQFHHNILDGITKQIGRRTKNKEKKQRHTSSYLRTNH